MTVVERRTGLVKMKRVTNKTALLVADAMINLLAPVKLQVKTITSEVADKVRAIAQGYQIS